MAEKTAEELEREIEELDRQRKEITERLRDPRGLRLRRGNFVPNGGGGGVASSARQRGFIRPADRIDSEDQPLVPPPKRRLSSAVVKDGGEVTQPALPHLDAAIPNNKSSSIPTKDSKHHHLPRVLPKHNDPSLLTRNRRMLGSILGTLEKFQKEDMHLSATEAYMRRSNSLQRAEQRAREESEKLRQQEREKIAENRRRDLTLRARVAAKAEEKKLELLFLKWSENHKLRGNFLRTKAEPSIYYLATKPLDEDETMAEQKKEKAFQDWKMARREELSEYQKQIGEQYLANVETELERWQSTRSTRRGNNNNNMINLQETMDRELETHQLEHGPKTRKIPGGAGNNEDEEDVEDINVGEDDLMDDVLVVDDSNRRVDVASKPDEAGNGSPSADDI